MDSQIGRTLDVIFEEQSDRQHYIGTSGNYLKFSVPLKDKPYRRPISIAVTGLLEGRLTGIAIK